MSNKVLGGLITAFAGMILLFVSVFIVDQTQLAIVIELGKPVRTITTPGLHVKMPFIQEVIVFDNRIQHYEASKREIITRDKKTLVVDNFAKWRIIDPLKFYQSVRDESGAQTRLDDIIYSELRVDLGTKDLTEIVSGGRAEIMEIVTRSSTAKAVEYGLEVIDVRIKRAELPPENERAVYDRMQAERGREAKRYRSQGDEEAQKIRSQAEKDREILLAEAYKTAQEIMGQGDATAFKTYAAAYNQDPGFFEFTRSMEAYKVALKNNTTLVTSSDGGFLKFLKNKD